LVYASFGCLHHCHPRCKTQSERILSNTTRLVSSGSRAQIFTHFSECGDHVTRETAISAMSPPTPRSVSLLPLCLSRTQISFNSPPCSHEYIVDHKHLHGGSVEASESRLCSHGSCGPPPPPPTGEIESGGAIARSVLKVSSRTKEVENWGLQPDEEEEEGGHRGVSHGVSGRGIGLPSLGDRRTPPAHSAVDLVGIGISDHLTEGTVTGEVFGLANENCSALHGVSSARSTGSSQR
jgi:hypothetical protein